MKRSRIKLLCLVSVIATILFASGPSSAWFWSNNPGSYNHDLDPGCPTDGSGDAHIDPEQGAEFSVSLFGSTFEGTPTPIVKTGEEAGWSCMWVIAYDVSTNLYSSHDTIATVTLQLYYYDNGWDEVDNDTVSAFSTSIPNRPTDQDDGWLYVWHDSAYEEGDLYMLKATASCFEYVQSQWVHFYESPVETSVYFVIHEV